MCILSEFEPMCRKCHRDHKVCIWWSRSTTFDLNDDSGWVGLDAIYHQHCWPLPSTIDKNVALKVTSLQMVYDKEQRKANCEGSTLAR